MSKWTLEDFKKAIHGNKGGILKHLTLLPNPPSIIGEAQKEFYSESGLTNSSNVDKQLCWLLDKEYQIYQQYQSRVYTNFLAQMSHWVRTNPGRHHCLDDLVEKLTSKIYGEKMLDVMPDEVAMAFVALEGSISQGRRSRAGGSLMEQLEFVLNIHGFHKNMHFMREQKVGGKQTTKLDYVFPNLEFMNRNASQSVTCANMTTINDRYRLAVQQLQPNTIRRVLTALGAPAFMSDISKLSSETIETFHINQVKVVVLEDAVVHLNDNFGVVQTYTEWFEELKIMSNFW